MAYLLSFFNFITFFITLLLGGAGVELLDALDFGVMVALGEFDIDFTEGHIILPAAEALAGQFADFQMIADGGEGSSEVMEGTDGDTGTLTGGNGVAVDLIWVALMDVGGGLIGSSGQGGNSGNEDGNCTGGGFVLIGLFMDKLIFFIEHCGTTDVDEVVLQVDVVPGDVQNFGFPQGIKRKQHLKLTGIPFDCVYEQGDFIGCEKIQILFRNGGQGDMDALTGGLGDDGGDKEPGVFQILGADQIGFGVYKLLPFFLWRSIDVPGHGILEAVPLNFPVAPDRFGRFHFTRFDIAVDGFT